MKRLILRFVILLSALLSSCATKKQTYFIIVGQDHTYIESKSEKKPLQVNRFEKQFNQADSVFMTKLREISRQAANEASKRIYNR